MADVKISQLPASTTPLDGTEVLPIVQSATTKQVSVANLTAGRAMAASSLTLTTPLAVTSGGTGIATAAQGSLLSATGADTFSATRTPTLGLAGTAAGTLGLSGSTSGVVTLATAATAGTWTLTLPTSGGTNGYILTTNGAGVSSWTNPTALGIDLDVGTTAITGGTTTRVLYNNAGVLGEYAVTGTGTTAVLSTSPTFTTGLTTPLAIGGTTASSSLTLQSTSGVGTSDSILFKVGNNGATTAATIDTSGNLGLGVTPSAWSLGKTFDIGIGSALSNPNSSGQTWLATNAYYNAGWKYKNSTSASYYEQTGAHAWYVAPSGTAGAAITFTQSMTLDASGNLGLNNTSPSTYTDGQGVTLVTGTSPNWATIQGRADGPAGAGNGVSYGGSYSTNPINGARIFVAASGSSGQQGQILFYTKNVDDNVTQPSVRMTLDASGNLLVGTSTVASKLTVSSTSSGAMATFGRGTGLNYITAGSASNTTYHTRIGYDVDNEYGYIQAFAASGVADDLVINLSGGNVGIGTSSPQSLLDVTGNDPTIRLTDNAGSPTATWSMRSTDGNYVIRSVTASSDRLVIDTSGNLLVGLTSAVGGSRVEVKGVSTTSAAYQFYGTDSAGTIGFYVRNDGVFCTGVGTLSPYNNTTASAANTFVQSNGVLQRSTSSLRYKTEIQDAIHGLSEVLNLRSVTYKGKNDGDKVFGGLIAEEVDAAGLTEFVVYDSEGQPDALHYGNMAGLFVKAIQELAAKVQALEAKVQ